MLSELTRGFIFDVDVTLVDSNPALVLESSSIMKNVVLAIANSVSEVLAETERLCRAGTLQPLSARLLEMMYVLGWDDGFVEFDRSCVATTLREKSSAIDQALTELQSLEIVSMRRGERHEVAELIALSAPRASAQPHLGWWQIYSIELFDDAE